MKETIRQLAKKSPLSKSFEVFEVTEDDKDVFCVFLESLEGITIADCALVSKFIFSQLPEDICIELTVSSAGIDKPLRSPIQFQRSIGKKIELETTDGIKMTGVLTAYSSENIVIVVTEKKKKETEYRFNINQIKQVNIKLF
jgi:ribosome maturation factor RimP